MEHPITGVYGILPADLDTDTLLIKAEAALKGGLQTLQFRDKKSGYKRALKRALALRELTTCYHARFIINDSIQLAQASSADGVHLGRDDVIDLAKIREDIGANMTIGITCRADAVFAKLALEYGADYVSFGAVFGSQSKPDVATLGLPRLNKARQMFPDASICAIGGITIDNIASVKHAGATSAAIISGLFGSNDDIEGNIERRAGELIEIWNKA
ncbi:MAG: thiamine phosphate synthase [Mariprofundaceae bacterium]|nr:thiamine phosphate synthase [Mariprofundaceae bacterium]